ncbi:MAG: 2,3-epoxybenzoyl-CoA dihydrolase [Betaproteobacteria bacterium]|nr:2,3-epoxybenzoyl-CoA dihydrolase [Betaproteobacteria bacterium]
MNAPLPAGGFLVSFDTHPGRYSHWKLTCEGEIATLLLDVAEDKGLVPGYKLKLNSYDLGVDIELHDALNRVRFEHPEVKAVIMTSGKSRMFCSGANIYMLGTSTHAWKVNFCKFTNETRNGIEDSSERSGLKFIAALNGTTAGGGYELALACDEIALVDDRSTTVSLPEVPLLGVLPGTGGLTRLIDKRKVRRDLADIFCTTAEGVRADRAKEWKLVDSTAKPQGFADLIKNRALELAKRSDRPGGKGVALTPIERTIDESGYHYTTVDVQLNATARTATITVKAPEGALPATPEAILAAGAKWWPLRLARELDDAILMLRHNHLDIGLWLLKTRGKPEAVLESDRLLESHAAHWFVRETIGMLRRTLARLDVSSRSMFAIIDPDSCFAGTLAELMLAADRSYMLQLPEDGAGAPRIALSVFNFGTFPTVSGATRIQARFCEDPVPVAAAREVLGEMLDAHDARDLGLVTATPDDLDWEDEIRLAIEERASLSPDALTGMEASLRFTGRETMLTRIFSRLSAWQNWIFIRPNAVGETGALKVYGTGARAKFNWDRV